MHHDSGEKGNPSIPPYILQGHAEDGSGSTTSETVTGREGMAIGINPAGRGHVDLLSGSTKDDLPTTLAHEGSKFCKLLLLELKSLLLTLESLLELVSLPL